MIPMFNNPRTRSFLSPSQKVGCRSLSTSDSHSNFYNTTSIELSSWKKIKDNKQKNSNLKVTTNKQPKIKLAQFQRKLQPQTIHKNSKIKPQFETHYAKQNIRSNQEYLHQSDSSQLHVLIKQMKDKIRLLQKQNLMLREQQVEDISLIRKQNQVIYQLQSVIKELSNRQQIVRRILEGLELEKFPKIGQLQCLQCRQTNYFDILKKNISKQLGQAVLKLKDERDCLKKQVNQNHQKINYLIQENYTYSRRLQQLNTKYHLPETLLQIYKERNSQINEIESLLKGI